MIVILPYGDAESHVYLQDVAAVAIINTGI
jgi:hypothetical protein